MASEPGCDPVPSEPPADEYSIADLKSDVPAGEYRISGIDYEGTKRVGTVVFTHAILAPPEITSPTLAPEKRPAGTRPPSAG